MTTEQEDRPGNSRFWLGVSAFLLFLLPLLYLLSTGPAVWLAMRFSFMEEVLTILYAPLAWLIDNNTLFSQFMLKYIELWVDIPF